MKKTRNNKNILKISFFLETTELIKKLQKEKIDENAIKKITLFCASALEHQFIEKGEKIFKQGKYD